MNDLDKIPFKFYKESIKAFNNNLDNKEDIWKRYKLVKYMNPNKLIKININKLPLVENKIYLCNNPKIYLIDNYITQDECNYIINKANNRLRKQK